MMVAYVGMGLPTAALGVAWKSMRADFHRPLSSLGVVVVAFTVGYLGATGTHRWVAARLASGPLLAVASALAAGGALAFATTGSWLVLLAGAVLLGLSAGTVDAALNAQVALHHSNRMMNVMHGSFGLGATLGPLVLTALLGWGVSWRWGYAGLGLLQVGLVIGFALTASAWVTTAGVDGAPVVPVELGEVELPVAAGAVGGGQGPPGDDPPGPGSATVPTSGGGVGDLGLERRRRRAAWLGPLVFLAYGAAEVGIGSWAFVLLTSRGMGTTAAGVSVTVYWGALAAGRLGLGAAGPRIAPAQVMAVSVIGAVVGGLGLWALPSVVSPVAMVVLGLSLAGMFPALMALTPGRVGPSRTRAVISNQLAASVVGGAAWSAAVGLVAQHLGPAAIAPALALACGLVAVTDVALTAASA